jgi:hypothetical protein
MPLARMRAQACARSFTDVVHGATVGRAGQTAAGVARRSRKVRTPKGRVVERSTRGNPRESATETYRRRPPSHVNGGRARVKWCGKSAPASRRRGGWVNPTRCKVKTDRSQVTRRGPGGPHRWMAVQRQNPAYRPAKEKPRSGGAFLRAALPAGCAARAPSPRPDAGALAGSEDAVGAAPGARAATDAVE